MHCHNIIRYYSRAWTFLSFFIFLSFSFRFLMNAALTQWTLSVYDSISCCKLEKNVAFLLVSLFCLFYMRSDFVNEKFLLNSYWSVCFPIKLSEKKLEGTLKWNTADFRIKNVRFGCSATTILIFFTLRNNDFSVSSHLKIISASLLSIQSFRCSMRHTAKDNPSNFSQ